MNKLIVPLKQQGQLSSAQMAAKRVLAFLHRPDFSQKPVCDVRD